MNTTLLDLFPGVIMCGRVAFLGTGLFCVPMFVAMKNKCVSTQLNLTLLDLFPGVIMYAESGYNASLPSLDGFMMS